jgi:VWFA-related protein
MSRPSALALLVTAAAALGGQTPPPQTPVFKTEANYVRVDVFPTADGRPVTDLTQADFEILEDHAPQKIDAFEHIVVRGNIPQETRREPNTVAESRAMMEDPAARLFVIFLDTYHVEVAGSHRIRKPLIDALNRAIGQDDLVGVMTPEMSARDVAFARKTTTIEGMLTRNWPWGERDRLNSIDPIEDQYIACYPGLTPPPRGCVSDAGIAKEMIYRRREARTLAALHDLVGFLRGVREERKAVIAISDGWQLFRPNEQLARPICDVPSGPDVSIDPRTGKLTTRRPNELGAGTGTSPADCERDRAQLSHVDHDLEFRRLLDEANRSNTSFYPIDPRGLAVFDEQMMPPIGDSAGAPGAMVPPSVDRAQLTARLTSLRTLAEATDGLAIVNSNNLDAGLGRVVADLSSYYLLGYYSTGKLDGKFHAISVHVKRPGVQVRARRGFLAATTAEATAAAGRGAAAAETPEASAAAEESRAVAAALAPLTGYTRELPLRMLAASGWKADRTAGIWVVAEAGRGEDWMGGGEATAMLLDRAGTTVATATAPIEPNTRSVRLVLVPPAAVPPGEYDVRLRVKSAGGAAATTDSTRVTLAPAPRATGAIFLRRGPTTGNRDAPTADLRFRRTERLKVEVPGESGDAVTARLLDRTGKLVAAIPVASSTRVDPDGSRWQIAQLSLVPLGIGDYVIEVAAGATRTLAAFRIVP